MRRMACQEVAKAKIFEKFASTFFALVPTSATLMEKSGLRAAIATVSAVEVLPTPGGPVRSWLVAEKSHMLWAFTIEEYHQTFSLLSNYVVHDEPVIVTPGICCPVAVDKVQDHFLSVLSVSELDSVP